MFLNQHSGHPGAKWARDGARVVAYRVGAEQRITAAQAKRERKAAKRAAVAQREQQRSADHA